MICRKINYTDNGIVKTGWYRIKSGIQHFNSSDGSSQVKDVTENKVIRAYKGYISKPYDALYLLQPKKGVKGEFAVVESISDFTGKKNNILLSGIMNEHCDVLQITENKQFLEEMVTKGNEYPNSVRRIAKKCFEYFKSRI